MAQASTTNSLRLRDWVPERLPSSLREARDVFDNRAQYLEEQEHQEGLRSIESESPEAVRLHYNQSEIAGIEKQSSLILKRILEQLAKDVKDKPAFAFVALTSIGQIIKSPEVQELYARSYPAIQALPQVFQNEA